MKTIVLLISFAVFPGFLQAQINKDDLLISRVQYGKLRADQAKSLLLPGLQARIDSLLLANNLVASELENTREQLRTLGNTIDHLERKNMDLQEANAKLNIRNNAMRSTANKYRFRYEQGPRFREHKAKALIWAGLMTAGFYFAMQDNHQQAALIGVGLSSVATITLALTLK